MAALGVMFSLGVDVSPVSAQPPPSNPNQMCGTGETFTVSLPGTSLGISDTSGVWRNVQVPDVAAPDSVTLPQGCRIYAFLISGFGDNPDYDRIIFYKVAEFVAQNDGYVHVGWWNNLTAPYMERPLHPETITIQKVIPILGIPVGDPVVIFPTPKTAGVPESFINPVLDLPKANPDEDTQFVSDAREVLKAVRQHNPDALILVAGHSMGGNAVARLGTYSDLSIDLLAPIDPVGNRDMPLGEGLLSNVTRWRATHNFNGYKMTDCIRSGFLNLCHDYDTSFFGTRYRCVAVGEWLDIKPVLGTLAPLSCPREAYTDPGAPVRILSSVKRLYHRWQREALWPVDFLRNETFGRNSVGSAPPNTTNILSTNYQAPILPQLNPLLSNDRDKTCSFGTDPRDDSFMCNPTDGHGEIIGVRVADNTRVRPGLQLINWPPRSSTFTPGQRRDRLIQLAGTVPNGPAWPYRPENPELCLVCDDIIEITSDLMKQQQWEEGEEPPIPGGATPDGVAPTSLVTQEPNATANGWNNGDVVVTVGATDDRPGLNEITLSLSGAQTGSTTTPGNSATATIVSEGLTIVSYFARDEAGNSEEVQTLEVRIDKTAPEITAVADIPINGTGWIGAPAVVSFPSSDNDGGSGLAVSSPDQLVNTEGAAQATGGVAEDVAGNVSTAFITLNIDLTPPGIALASRQPAANAAGWNNSPVTVTWTCTDALSGAVAPSNAMAVGSEGAAQSATGNCQDLADHVSTDTLGGINIDTTAPSVSVTAPANGAVLLLNSLDASSYACSDSLAGVHACEGPVASGAPADTSSPGNKQFLVNATDMAGNTASVTHSYSVQYSFSGFTNPVAPMPLRNVVNAGRTVPVKYVLRDANDAPISSLATFSSLVSTAVACDGAAPGALAEDTAEPGSTQIRWDATAQQFIFHWKTEKAWEGTCRTLQLTLNDGTKHLALFQFR